MSRQTLWVEEAPPSLVIDISSGVWPYLWVKVFVRICYRGHFSLHRPLLSKMSPTRGLRHEIFIERGGVAGYAPLCCQKKHHGCPPLSGLLPGSLLRPPGFFAASFVANTVVPAVTAGKGTFCTSSGLSSKNLLTIYSCNS